jgi:hypothetical protein
VLENILDKLTSISSKNVCDYKFFVDTAKTEEINTFLLSFAIDELGICDLNAYPNIQCLSNDFNEECNDCGVPQIDFVEYEAFNPLEVEWIAHVTECELLETKWIAHELCCKQC